MSRIPAQARGLTKVMLRKELGHWLQNNKDQDFQNVMAILTDPIVQKDLQQYLAKLSRKQK